ncbi:GSU2403 family nucleotidyltransferase fold protein [Janthinobacterium sp. 17J80-10]|uniref:GSU2403 family nucleotidyltransferase fold protein n=1 Tax=Janthinobacterium sp. 17J80-10 TaxID=2497863 RepID=UPI001005A404|nr:GSU2403 family nucleotidyltransferase fold protein [Janthinobacterium sp. 17J80-10]QAU35112.1 hypothetical protein EKL02_13495 [Janthinobacterium sp. 17J80-10]
MKRLPDNIFGLYADLLQKVEGSKLAALHGGSYVSKRNRGSRYWYYQTRTLGGQVQRYLGKETEELLAQIEAARQSQDAFSAIMNERKRLVAMLIAGGATPEKGRPAKILEKMADAGVFSSGGVLIGSFGFACYGSMLGVRFDDALHRTEDMDFGFEREVQIAIQRNLKDDLVGADESFVTPRQINPWVVPNDMVTPDGFKVEFLTTKATPQDKAPVPIARFAIHAQPLDFLDYLIEDVQDAVVLSGAGIPVSVPNPARFALHKLAISQRRPVGHQAKAKKDLAQAGEIIEVLATDNPGALLLAHDAILKRQDQFGNVVMSGAVRLSVESKEALKSMLPQLLS